jgi:hypothetical protein
MTHSDENIKEIILTNRPKLSHGSINTYMASYRKIKSQSDINVDTPKDIVDNHKELLEWMRETMTPNIRKSKIACLVIIIDDKKDGDENKDIALKAFRNQMTDDGKTVDDKEINQELSERQKKNLISQKEVADIYSQLKSQATPLFKLSQLNKNQFNLLQSYVLLSLYVLIAPRRSTDYTAFKIRNFDSSPQSVDNYMFNFNRSKKKPSSFIFNTYKNANRMGRQIIEIPKSLEKIINEWSKFNKSDYLLVNNSGNPIAPSKITYWLNQIFGKSISTSMLRHIFLSDKFGGINLKELESTAEAMGQSDISRTLKYVQKDADKVIAENEK